MRFVRPVCLSVLALVAVGNAPAAAQEPPVPPDRWHFDMGTKAWNTGSHALAVAAFEAIVKGHPASEFAPEASYRLAAAYLLLGKTAESKKAMEALVRDYFPSTWAQLALAAHYEEAPLGTLADDKRKQARATGKREDALAAVRVHELYTARFPKGSRSKEQLAYTTADCHLLAGNRPAYEDGMKAAQQLARDSGWGKLAAIRLGGEQAFRQRMDELINLRAGDNEQFIVFLDLAGQFFDTLPEDDRVKCLYYKARCLGAGKKAEALAIYQGLVRDHPESRWAADSAFWIAESHFSGQEFGKARAAFLAMAEKYPQSPRAAVARSWAELIDRQDEACKELEQVLGRTIAGLVEGRGGLGLRLEGHSEDPTKRLQARFAWQNETQNAFFSLRYGQASMLLASNKQGGWYQFGDRTPLVKSAQRFKLPAARLRIDADPVTRQLGFWAGTGAASDEKGGPAFQISPHLAPALVLLVKSMGHLSREVRPDGRGKEKVVYQLQSPRWDTPRPESVELEVGPGGKVREVRCLWWDSNGKQNVWAVSEITLGEVLPDSAFEVSVPAGTEVRTTAEMNEMEVFMQVLAGGARLVSDIQSEFRLR